jgi:hypothetical protein
MSKHSVQMRALMRSGKAQMEYQARGIKPKVTEPVSALITLLESISPRKRVEIKNIHLSPKLGYSTGANFNNAEQLLRWLKPNNWMSGAWPAESYRHKQFIKPISMELFLTHVKTSDS